MRGVKYFGLLAFAGVREFLSLIELDRAVTGVDVTIEGFFEKVCSSGLDTGVLKTGETF